MDQTNYKTAEFMDVIIGRYLETKAERQDQLRQIASNIKMNPNRSAVEYVTKHGVLRKGMIDEGCKEITTDTDQKVTMR